MNDFLHLSYMFYFILLLKTFFALLWQTDFHFLFVSVSVYTQQIRASPHTALLQQPIALEWGAPIQLLTDPNVA